MQVVLHKRWLTCLLVLSLVGLSGCSKHVTPMPSNGPSQTRDTATLPDGTIISKQLVDHNDQVNVYKIFYMSAGERAEAFISEPTSSGTYPLFVNLHGGYAAPQPIQHYNFGYDETSLSNASDTMVEIEPEYRGYMASDGTVQGLAGDTLDTQNAIKAAMSFGNVAKDATYLLGYSMGGGVALNIASQRKDVRAVVAVSPFVGWDEIIRWMDSHPNVTSPSVVKQLRGEANVMKQTFANFPGMEQQNSLLNHIPDIQAPVLFLQGTGDQNVVWQTVQQYASDMQKAHKNVRLVVYPGGAHGLHDKYQSASNQEILGWFNRYGLSDPWM